MSDIAYFGALFDFININTKYNCMSFVSTNIVLLKQVTSAL